MKQYIQTDPWKIVEDGFHPEHSLVSESLFSIANGFMGTRAFFEEGYSGDTLHGSYFAGIYYPDKTKVGWWKIGYPEYFAKVLNAVNWISLPVLVGEEQLDLGTGKIHAFRRELDMQTGILKRTFEWESPKGARIRCEVERLCSLADRELGTVVFRVQHLQNAGKLTFRPGLDFDVYNQDANWEEKFWKHGVAEAREGYARISATTKKTNFTVTSAMCWDCEGPEPTSQDVISTESYVANALAFETKPGETVTVFKFVCNQSSLYQDPEKSWDDALSKVTEAALKGYASLRDDHAAAWEAFWQNGDVVIEGDLKAQQGIRFNIFQLWQTYQGHDARLNIGPKGFTGEKYGGSTYWDTEAYCLPFYLGTCKPEVAKNLLFYRYKHLQKAIENAAKLGFTHGAALYPMVTMNGEECHNEWEITFEEIHRNGAIAYAIYDYIRYTGDGGYMYQGGLEVLIGIARFWAQRFNWSEPKGKYVMLGVTGPNEYENNVNNNWYTSFIARWCLQYTMEQIAIAKKEQRNFWSELETSLRFQEGELETWMDICNEVYLPEDPELGIFLQQDDYLDKEQVLVPDLPASERPINQNWSWDRILRSCFIKQADVLQGLYFFEEQFDEKTLRRNFEFYEPRTVHESSLSPCIHAILAARLGMREKAYEMYLRTARLDLEDYNNDTEDGLHITSMAGTWLAVVKGFAGTHVQNDILTFDPRLPYEWDGIRFHVHYRGALLQVRIAKNGMQIRNMGDLATAIRTSGAVHELKPGETREFALNLTRKTT